MIHCVVITALLYQCVTSYNGTSNHSWYDIYQPCVSHATLRHVLLLGTNQHSTVKLTLVHCHNMC